MTRQELEDLLGRLRAPVLPPKLKAASTRYRFQLEDGETWDLLLEGGRLTLATREGSPDCLVECSRDECQAILSGRHNFLTAFIRGDVRVRGALTVGKNLYTFLRCAQIEEAKA